MNNHESNVHSHTFPAVVEVADAGSGKERPVRILHRDGIEHGWTWLPPLDPKDGVICKANITSVRAKGDQADTLVVTAIDVDPALDVFDLIPDRFGRKEGIVFRCRDVVEVIRSISLRRFLSDVFSMPFVYRHFWTCPASQNHHHAYAGGLADHSVEMAEDVAASPRLTETERELGIAYALLHDIGKLWCYTADGTYGDPLGHELAAIDQLHVPLARLAESWPDGATAMRSFLSGLWKQRGRQPIMAVGKLVQALDQGSAERERRRSAPQSCRPWMPAREALKVAPHRAAISRQG